MSAAAIVTVVLVGVLVGALAVTLIAVLLTLRRTSAALADISDAVRGIAEETRPIGGLLADVAGHIGAIADVAEPLIEEQAADQETARG